MWHDFNAPCLLLARGAKRRSRKTTIRMTSNDAISVIWILMSCDRDRSYCAYFHFRAYFANSQIKRFWILNSFGFMTNKSTFYQLYCRTVLIHENWRSDLSFSSLLKNRNEEFPCSILKNDLLPVFICLSNTCEGSHSCKYHLVLVRKILWQ